MGFTAAAPPLGFTWVSRAGVLRVQRHCIVGAGLCPLELAALPHVEDIALLFWWGLQALGGQMMPPRWQTLRKTHLCCTVFGLLCLAFYLSHRQSFLGPAVSLERRAKNVVPGVAHRCFCVPAQNINDVHVTYTSSTNVFTE
jgi:hypothetical protein